MCKRHLGVTNSDPEDNSEVEAIVNKIDLRGITAAAWADGTIGEAEANETMLTAITYAVDVLKYRDFLLSAAEKELSLSGDELGSIAVLREVTTDEGPCVKSLPLLTAAMQADDDTTRADSLRNFVAEWEKSCSSKAKGALETLKSQAQ